MTYVRTTWVDKSVERPRTYTETTNGDGSITHTPSEGTVFEAGTPVNATNLNNIEDGIEELQDAIKTIPYSTDKTVDFTFSLDDAGQLLTATSSSAIVATIPDNGNAAFPVGTEIVLARMGTGAVSFTNAAGVTILSTDSKKKIYKQYEAASATKIGTDTWLLLGSLTN